MSDNRKLQGERGESIVRRQLARLDSNSYVVLNNYCFEYENHTTQIDHLILSVYGIFVIETKNYSGKLEINIESSEWTYYRVNANSGKVSDKGIKVINPYKQNDYHINLLSRILGVEKSKFANMVVLADKNITLNEGTEDYILWYDELITYIQRASKHLFTLQEISKMLTQLKKHLCSEEYHLKRVKGGKKKRG